MGLAIGDGKPLPQTDGIEVEGILVRNAAPGRLRRNRFSSKESQPGVPGTFLTCRGPML